MKVITTNREIIYSNACGCSGADGYLNVNGNSGSGKILAFQKFANKKGFKDSEGKPLVEDGIWGRNTNQAAAVYGKEFDTLVASDAISIPKTQNPLPKKDESVNYGPETGIGSALPKKDEPKKKGMMDTVADLFKKDETNPPVSTTKPPEDAKAAKKKKMIRIALIGGGLIALGAIIIAISKRKK